MIDFVVIKVSGGLSGTGVMMSTVTKTGLSPEEYLALEREAPFKSEYRAGEVVPTAGTNRRHSLIVTNLVRDLSTRLRGRPCETYSTDMRVEVGPGGLYTYPDVVVVCGEARSLDEREDTLLNPTLIVEVLSPSTEAYDRGEKFASYQRLVSLKSYVLISQDAERVEHYAQQADGRWILSEASGREATVALESIDCELPLADVYNQVEHAPTDGKGAAS